ERPGGLVLRVSSFKYKEFEAKFDERLREVKERAESIRTGGSEVAKLPQEATEYEELVQIGEVSPRAAIAEAWRRVELAATEAARVAHIDAPPRSSVTLVVRSLVREGVFSESAVEVFDQLRRLRNEAVHAPEFALNFVEVEPYIELALRLAQDLFHAGNAAAFGRGYLKAVSVDG
ncbi:MAG: hypothetical protein IMZ55_07710, partial [Acidobacteria bacterium]|nr:hypothetical protein [Acidobacteriota bacterium]